MKPLIFDSSALVAYFLREEGGEKVAKVLKSAVQINAPLHLSPIQLGEVFYIISRKEGPLQAQNAVNLLEEMLFETPTLDKELALSAAQLKLEYDLGYADAFAAALALQKNGELVTGDKDFKPLEKNLKIHWI